MMNALDAARSYLGKLPPAISGAGGHDATFRAACSLVRFGLNEVDARFLFGEWNRTHCQPPWTERELNHKLSDARRVASCGHRFTKPRPAVRTVWKIQRKQPPAELAKAAVPVMPLPLLPANRKEPLSGIWIIEPGESIPSQFVDVLRTWPAFRQHPAWRDHPQLI